MSMRLLRYGVPVLFLSFAACDRADVAVTTGPTALSSSGTIGHAFSVEPAALHPEFLPAVSCVQRSPFGTRILIVIRGGDDVILRGVRFRFLDRFGINALPRVVPIPGSSPFTVPASTLTAFDPIPTPGIAPLPMTPPIPIPGASPISGVLVPFGTSRSFPFFLTFSCGVASEGTLFVFIDSAGPNGGMQTSEIRARVGL